MKNPFLGNLLLDKSNLVVPTILKVKIGEMLPIHPCPQTAQQPRTSQLPSGLEGGPPLQLGVRGVLGSEGSEVGGRGGAEGTDSGVGPKGRGSREMERRGEEEAGGIQLGRRQGGFQTPYNTNI